MILRTRTQSAAFYSGHSGQSHLVLNHIEPRYKDKVGSVPRPLRGSVLQNAVGALISSNAVCGPCDSFPCTLHERIKNSCTEFQGEKSMTILRSLRRYKRLSAEGN